MKQRQLHRERMDVPSNTPPHHGLVPSLTQESPVTTQRHHVTIHLLSPVQL